MLSTQRTLGSLLHASADYQVALDLVRDTQAIYRMTLLALANPGTVRQMPVPAVGAPVNGWAAALLITLLDHEVSLASSGAPAMETIAHFVRQRTAAAKSTPAAADFLLTDAAGLAAALATGLRTGNLHYPDESATVIAVMPCLSDVAIDGPHLTLAGPGIERTAECWVGGLSPAAVAARCELVREYPLGVDLLLVDARGRLLGLPRTTNITVND